MHRVFEAEQIEILYDCADRCQRCQELACKQPAFVEVVFCPRFVAIEPHPNTRRTVTNKKTKRYGTSL
ncbi:hypothetical protein [Effusibacillus consociatus]|uniref:Uncharacterized protein n=1 Tax=Effusibacillus consociatus TaxID=1117041 RepID=A0ABV9Q2W5_9BACL